MLLHTCNVISGSSSAAQWVWDQPGLREILSERAEWCYIVGETLCFSKDRDSCLFSRYILVCLVISKTCVIHMSLDVTCPFPCVFTTVSWCVSLHCLPTNFFFTSRVAYVKENKLSLDRRVHMAPLWNSCWRCVLPPPPPMRVAGSDVESTEQSA